MSIFKYIPLLFIAANAFALNQGAVNFEDAPKAQPLDYYIQADDGWWPYLSPDGKKVVYGNGGSYLAEIGKRYEFIDLQKILNDTCRQFTNSGRWISANKILMGCLDNGAELYEVEYGTWKTRKIDTSDVDSSFLTSLTGGGLVAGDGHWAAVYAGTPLIYDGAILGGDGELGLPAITGNLLYTPCDNGTNEGPICVYQNSQLKDEFEIQGLVGGIDAIGGYVAWGGYGPGTFGRDPSGEIINLGVAGGQFEDGAPKLFSVDGKIWIGAFNGFNAIFLRPWGQKEVIIVNDAPAAAWDVGYDGKDIVITAASDKGKLHIIKVSKNSPRVDLCGDACSDLPDSQVPITQVAASTNASFSSPPQPSIPTGYPGFGQLIALILTWAFRIVGAVFLFAAYVILYTINPDLVKGTFSLPGIGF